MLKSWIFTYFCGIVFIHIPRLSAIFQNEHCSPTQVNITVELDPSKGVQFYPINFTCSNWNDTNLTFVISVGQNASKHFKFELAGRQNVYKLRVNSTSTPAILFNSSINIEDSLFRTVNIVPLNILVKRKQTIEITLLYGNNITEESPPGEIIAKFKVNSLYPANLIVHSDDIPESFALSKIENNTFHIETLEIIDLDIFRKGNNCCSFEFEYFGGEDLCPQVYDCDHDHVEYEFTVQVSDPTRNVTKTSRVYVMVMDINDHSLMCKDRTVKFSRYKGTFDLYSLCTDDDYSYGMTKFSTTSSTCEEELDVVENKYVEVVVEEISTKTSCQYVLNATDGEHYTKTKLTIKFKECPRDTDNNHQLWNISNPGTYSNGSCPTGFTGTVRRYCTLEGYYEDPIYNCTSVRIMEIFEEVNSGNIDVDKSLDKLSDFTSTNDKNNDTFQLSDTVTVVNILSKITDNLNESSTNLPEISDKYLQVVDNIIDAKSISSGNASAQKTQVGAEKIIETLDTFTEKIANGNLTADIEVPKPNLYLKIARITTCDNNVEFPDRKSSENVANWTKYAKDVVKLPCAQRTFSSKFSGIVYRDPSKLFNTGSSNDSTISEINAPILSFSLFPTPNETLDEPVELIFDIYNKSYGNASCSYLSIADGTWATDGCWLVSYNKEDNTVTCHCNHLTNFAILMSPSDTTVTIVGEHFEALSTITLVGCIVSMVCLCVTVILFGFFWRYVRSPRTFIHINLSISLFIAYLIFVTGLEATENKDLCMAIAALLHFFLLVVFFTMLVEGLNLAFIVLKPISDKKPAIPLLIGAYIVSIIVTGVSLATHFNDYIRDNFCWLSVNSGVVWSFIGPVIAVIALNIIIVIIVVCIMFGTASMSRKTNKEKTKIAVRNIIILTPTLGLSWIIGIFAVNEHTIVFQYLFAILNSLQGLLIFIVHLVLNNKIRDAIRHRYSRWLSSRSISSDKQNKPLKFTASNSTTTSKL